MDEQQKNQWKIHSIEIIRDMCRRLLKHMKRCLGKVYEKHKYRETEGGFELEITVYGNRIKDNPTKRYSITRKYSIVTDAPKGSKMRPYYFNTDTRNIIAAMQKTFEI